MYVITLTTYSTELSKKAGLEVMLKIESVQPTGSFKLRGVGHTCETLSRQAPHFLFLPQEEMPVTP